MTAPTLSPAPSRATWPYLLVALAYLFALAALGSALPRHFGFPLDDSWIHQTVARNFAQFGSLGYLPHQRSSGSTSLLWTLLLSTNYALLPKLSPVLFCLGLNTLCLLGMGLCLLQIALRDGMPVPLALLWAVAPAANGNLVWLAFTGMEHLLFIALSLLAILLWFSRDHLRPRRTAALAGITLGLLAMTRPEGIALACLLLPLAALAKRSVRQALLASAITVLFAALPFAVNILTSGALLPVTFKGRQWMYFAGQSARSVYRMQLLYQWIVRPFKSVLPLDGGLLSPPEKLLIYALLAAILLLCALGLYTLLRERRSATLIVCVWAAVHSLLYLVILPVSGHGGRYQPFLLLLLTPLLALGIAHLSAQISSRSAVAIPAALLCLMAAVSLHLWRTVLAAGIDHIHDSHGAMAAFLNTQHLTEPVAVFDIGRIGYDRGGNLVDMGGLTDSSYVAYLYGNRVPEYLRQHAIRLVVLPADPDGFSPVGDALKLINNPALTLEPLHLDCTPRAIWYLGWIQTRHAAQCQQLFRIHPR